MSFPTRCPILPSLMAIASRSQALSVLFALLHTATAFVGGHDIFCPVLDHVMAYYKIWAIVFAVALTVVGAQPFATDLI